MRGTENEESEMYTGIRLNMTLELISDPDLDHPVCRLNDQT